MSSLVPNCAVLSPYGGTVKDHLGALKLFFDNDAKHWHTVDSNSENLLIQQGDQQVLFSVSGSDLEVQIDPEGGRSNVSDPASGAASPMEVGVSGTYSENRALIAEYEDAFVWLLYDSNNNHFSAGVHAGVVLSQVGANDQQLGITGHCMLLNEPRIVTINATAWLSGLTSNASKVRVGDSVWDNPRSNSGSNAFGGLVNGNMRYNPIPVASRGQAPNTGDRVMVGLTRYIREAESVRSSKVVLPSMSSNQGWLHVGHSTTNTELIILWDKTVTP